MMLTQRQQLLLRKAVEEYLQVGQPVGSKMLAGQPDVIWGSSTVRHELAKLEEYGFLAHPHTSAGRVPTDAGYRYFVDQLLKNPPPEPPQTLPLSLMRRELDATMRATTETLSQFTNLLAIVSAPPVDTAKIRHIEVLALQPQVVMVVVITSTGGVSKRIFTFEQQVDPGLVDWAGSYLNERLVDMGLGARMLHQRLLDDDLSPVERQFVQRLSATFSELAETAHDTIYMEGTARLLSEQSFSDLRQIHEVIELLERRVTLLSVIRQALSVSSVYVRIGRENEAAALHSVALVTSSYGLPRRKLGTVSVIGPMRMDYQQAISSVQSAALQLSHYVEEIYTEG